MSGVKERLTGKTDELDEWVLKFFIYKHTFPPSPRWHTSPHMHWLQGLLQPKWFHGKQKPRRVYCKLLVQCLCNSLARQAWKVPTSGRSFIWKQGLWPCCKLYGWLIKPIRNQVLFTTHLHCYLKGMKKKIILWTITKYWATQFMCVGFLNP